MFRSMNSLASARVSVWRKNRSVRTLATKPGTAARTTSIAASAVGLFLIGAAITLMTGRSVLFSGARQVLVGVAAAAITYGIGRLIGTSVG